MTSAAVRAPGWRAGTWRLDPARSVIGFVARYLVVSEVQGRFTEYTADITTGIRPEDTQVKVDVDLSSITTGDERVDASLRHRSLFSVENAPMMSFRSTRVHRGKHGGEMDGDLTICGVTRPVAFATVVSGFTPGANGEVEARVSASGQIGRSDFGITWNRAIGGRGMAVADRLLIRIEAVAVLQR